MRALTMVAVLAWWFIGPTGGGSFGPLGPFRTEQECEHLRAWTLGQGYNVSPCYETGVPPVSGGLIPAGPGEPK